VTSPVGARGVWRQVLRPLPLTVAAIISGWIGVWFIWHGHAVAFVLPAATTLFALTALQRGRAMGRVRQRTLIDALAAVEAHNRELDGLRMIAGTMLAVRTREELFSEVTRGAQRLLQCDGSSLLLLVEEGRFLKVMAGEGDMQRVTGALFPVDHSLTGWVVTHNESVICPDLQGDPRLYKVPELEGHLHNAVLAPLRSSGLVLGVLSVYNRGEPGFTPHDRQLLQTLADQVAFGLDRVTVLEESRKGEQALAVKNRELERATHLKSEFLANMSHELRTPLNAIIGFSDLLLTGEMNVDEQKEFLTSISRNGTHLLGLINNILDLSKIEAGRMTQTLGIVDLKVALQSAATDTASLRSARRQRSVIDLDEGPLEIQADGLRIRQILLNLLANASKFTPEEGEITLRVVMTEAPLPVPAGRAGDKPKLVTRKAVWVAVTDTGIGISPEDQARLFEPFSQVDSSASRRNQGTGLGLALCKQFVEMHGGTIGVESLPGKGSTFWFLLPVDGPMRRSGSDT